MPRKRNSPRRVKAAVRSGPSAEEVLQSDYLSALDRFDDAICEAAAVSQTSAGRHVSAHVGYASRIFARMGAHGFSIAMVVPKSRWARSDFEHWDFSAAAGHVRAIMEGLLLFVYLLREPADEAELKARINLMHLNDCTRRIKMFEQFGGGGAECAGFEKQRSELRERLTTNSYFLGLDPLVQKHSLSGDKLMFWSRAQQIECAGIDANEFNWLWLHLSQYTHILPFSFYRMSPNGRGTGMENPTDKRFLAHALDMAATLLRSATDAMVETFPDTLSCRKGKRSIFTPGPRENAPIETTGPIAEAIASALRGGPSHY